MPVRPLCRARQLLTRIDAALPQPWSPWFASLALLGVALIVADDFLLRRDDLPFVLNALTDEIAHTITALLWVGALYALRQWRWDRRMWVAALLGGTIIDLDHVPPALGWDGITVGTGRPYSHSLFTLGVLLIVIARLRRTRRVVGIAAAWALVSHYVRDLVDGGTIPLFWPITNHGFSAPYATYATLLLVCLCVIAIGRLHTRQQPVAVPSLGQSGAASVREDKSESVGQGS